MRSFSARFRWGTQPVELPCESVSLQDVLTRRQLLFEDARNRRARLVVVRMDGATDIMALRWIYPGGVMPLVFASGSLLTAARISLAAQSPAFVVVESGITAESFELLDNVALKSQRSVRDPLGPDDGAALDSSLKDHAEELASFVLDEGLTNGRKPDWLVISYGAASAAAKAAVVRAREQELAVQHLDLRLLFPLAERKLAALAMGKRFVVVPENNAGQMHGEIQRVVPGLPVVAVTGRDYQVSADNVFTTLMKFPRCC